MAESRRPDESVADLHRHLLIGKDPSDPGEPQRAATLPRDFGLGDQEGKSARFLKTPGGFRRQHVIDEAVAQGRTPPENAKQKLTDMMWPLVSTGYFERKTGFGEDGAVLTPVAGDSGLVQTALALWKGFVGPAITYMPAAFSDGGLGVSLIALVFLGFFNALCIALLLDCTRVTGLGTYGDIARASAGKALEICVLISLLLNQYGLCISYMIFMNKVTRTMIDCPEHTITAIQLVFVLPMCLIRSMHSLEYPNLIADALVMLGIVTIVFYASTSLISDGTSADVQFFIPETFGIFLGTSIFAFEGIPLILPIRESMREPERFTCVFTWVFIPVVLAYMLVGMVGYLDYGSNAASTALLNLPQGKLLATLAKMGYAFSMMFGTPLQFIPAARIVEHWVFGVSAKGAHKWSKNCMRCSVVLLFALTAIYGGPVFHLIVAFVGATCSCPVCFIYPAYFHLTLCAKTRAAKAMDCLILVIGVAMMLYVTQQTVTEFISVVSQS
eukprot:TRINITY_DN13689_c0_g1_i1.p1 TRINITY_DN13689_c0_g1~~TRINITY_DN13689_c0_g1_i1.p1  ORF type:complete len:522 (+),score=57.87 TRINITY_DN13689_c0_g1_i1:67-1566(+)